MTPYNSNLMPLPMGDLSSGVASMPLFAQAHALSASQQRFFYGLPEEQQQKLLQDSPSQQELAHRIEQVMRCQ